ncbi:T9SS type A sorting domain-containing protein [Psychroserpens damuponensis]|uniref:T9SS type A sorting domain-containing protein n=1 Tax=Psychroserpens damuponensis TaxID=943936 RepID=UPI0009FE805C|nr:T9SS type A sorting domain-containing protein [Psychroserpens damuponensis]
MKKHYALLALLLLPFFGMAQHLLDSIQDKIEYKLQHVDINTASTGIFYDRIYKKANLERYAKPITTIGIGGLQPIKPKPILTIIPQPSSYMHFFMAHDDLERADFQNRYTNTETLFQLNQNSGNTVNIGVINADITTFNGDPIALGTLNVVGVDSLLYKNTASTQPLYKDLKNCLAASPLKQKVTDKRVSFNINSSFWKETAQHTISTLQIDFADGQGFRTVTQGQTISVNYPNGGDKELKFKVTFSDNTTHEVKARLEVVVAPTIGVLQPQTTASSTSSCFMPTSDTFESDLSFQGYDESQPYQGWGRYQNHSNTTCIDKPVIVVEGYDPSDSFSNGNIYDQFNLTNLGNQLLGTGQDIFTLDFQNYTASDGKLIRDGSDYIERNAMVLIELINRINANKSDTAEPIKIVGFSMGGLVARYALRYMELNGMAHDTDLYVSVDAPQQGAVVPTGAQYTIDFIDDLVPSWADEELSSLTDDLFLPAPKQMLIHHFGSNTEFPDGFQGFHDRFYNDLNAMGYPQQARNIAVTNGRLDGLGTNAINQKYYEGKMYLFWVLLNGKLRLHLTNQDSRARTFYWRLKFLIFTVWKRERHTNSYASLGSYENAPGGIASVDDLDERITQFTSFGFDAIVAGMKQNLSSDAFSFLPTKSAIDYIGDPYLYENISNRDLSCANNTPFDSYFAPEVNEPHLFLSVGASNFIRQEILGNPQVPDFTVQDSDLKQQSTFSCSNLGNSIRFYFEECQIKQGVTWSVTEPNMISVIQEDNTQFEFVSSVNANGYMDVTAHIPNQADITKTVFLGNYFDFPANSNYYISANGTSISEPLNNGTNLLIPSSNGNLQIPYGVFAQQNLPTSWQKLGWELVSDSQNAVFSWNEVSGGNLNFSYLGNKHNATIVFRLNARTNCGIDYPLTYWFKIPEPDDNGGGFSSRYSAYPVPANQNLDIQTKQDFNGSPKRIEIYDMFSQPVYTGNLDSNHKSINTSSLRNGIYILKIWHDGKVLTKTISVQH